MVSCHWPHSHELHAAQATRHNGRLGTTRHRQYSCMQLAAQTPPLGCSRAADGVLAAAGGGVGRCSGGRSDRPNVILSFCLSELVARQVLITTQHCWPPPAVACSGGRGYAAPSGGAAGVWGQPAPAGYERATMALRNGGDRVWGPSLEGGLGADRQAPEPCSAPG